ncbi:hypothetical protein P8605_06005, partial [Streptomyces sp. T-3]|nr:hypothetical protein [Streptomyces sp. T-3]
MSTAPNPAMNAAVGPAPMPPSIAVAFTPTGAGAAAYYRAMTVTFASLRRFHPELRTVLVTDVEPPDRVREFAEVRIAPFRHSPPPGFVAEPMRGCLYLLDALEATAGEDVLFVDPDVICVAPLDGLFAGLGDAVGGYLVDYPEDCDVYGQTRAGAGSLHQLLGSHGELPPAHYGGECYWMPAARTPEVLHHTERAWTLSLERHAQGRSWLPTEEHLLGYPLNRMRVTDLRPYVRRIWTSARTRTVDGTERAVPLWHLPAEKQRGFQAL